MMSEGCCKRCGAADHVKNAIVRGLQRYHCLSFGCNFTMTPPQWQAAGDEGAGLASLRHGQRELLLHRTHSRRQRFAVLNWVRDEARKLPEPSLKAELVVVTLDEMWHFVKKGDCPGRSFLMGF